jgi:type IV pilus assembly protein PilV
MKTERGFTIIEVLVAVVILTIGLLGLVTTAALVTRMIGQGQRYTEAAALAGDRFEQLRSVSCAALANGTSTQGGFTVAWTVAGAGDSRQIDVTVTSPTNRGTRQDRFSTTRYC